ncbi:PREDICTED: uncharacterized protein LOC109178650 [Ipomoea nil]|uniref:uncharacterized protein LOC109178650 n=1 Tax=Ipomoea nil TaxID=35883 RepID=UPI000901488F|nr:PREDICTED: uncharacterized protein LOC109178650 [Ipomoea nil]
MRLSQFDIQFKPRPAIKGQALADFIVECTAREVTERVRDEDEEWWTLSTDGSSSTKSCGGGFVLITPEGFRAYYALRFAFKLSNNEVEYEALLGGLRLALNMRVEKLKIRCDSRLVVRQVTGEFEASDERMRRYRDVVLQLLGQLINYEVLQVPRDQNTDADILSKLAQGAPEHISKIARIENFKMSSLDAYPVLPVQTRPPCWLDHLEEYKRTGALPTDEADTKLVKRRAPTYVIMGDTLYKRSYNGALLRCLYPDEARAVMEEIHEGTCSAHQGAFAMSRRAILQGYFWPKMAKECADYARSCETCKHFQVGSGPSGSSTHGVGEKEVPHSGSGLLYQVGGGGTTGNYNKRPLQALCVQKHFVPFWGPDATHHRQRTPIRGARIQGFCAEWHITHSRVAVCYPQENGQVENANRTIVDGLKKKLESAGGAWVEELDAILWAYRTTPRRATGETPFSLAYGFEARAPAEVVIPSRREEDYDPDTNEEHHRTDLHLIDDRREAAAIRVENYQRQTKAYHDKRVRPRYFQAGDYVLRRREASQPQAGGKFAANWEGPYIVAAVVRPAVVCPGSYKLKTPKGKMIARVWNSEHLLKFY